MKVLQDVMRQYYKMIIIVAWGCCLELPLCGGGLDLEDISLLHLNVSHMRDKAELILAGNLQLLEPYRESSKSLYKIVACEVLKGNLPTNSLLVVHSDVHSYQGSDPKIESNVPYILFLEKSIQEAKKVPANMVCYQVRGTWKGIIPLDKNAQERRAIMFITRDYGVNILERLNAFKEALRYSIDAQKYELNQPVEDLNPEALDVYKGLHLGESREEQPMEHFSRSTEKTNTKINFVEAPSATISTSVQCEGRRSDALCSNGFVISVQAKPIREGKATKCLVFGLLVVFLVSGVAVRRFWK